jgi:aminomuconate-semialdehyde/2-hydroxymuconate-6-semialdehyde dehydrogenase
VQRGVFDEFVTRFVAAAEAVVLGDPKERATQVGPLASEEHYRNVRRHVEDVQAGTGRLATGGLGDGWTMRPSVVVDAPLDSRVVREEIFGPVVTVHPFDIETEAVALANDTRYGLNAMVFTENLARAHRVAAALRAGTVWVNCFFIRDLRAPFGGDGDSGLGREGGDFFTEPKAVVVQV